MKREPHRCHAHTSGRSLGSPIVYDPSCATCVERRGQLPENERDIPASADFLRRVRIGPLGAHLRPRPKIVAARMAIQKLRRGEGA